MITYKITNPRWTLDFEVGYLVDCYNHIHMAPEKKRTKEYYIHEEKEVETTLKRFGYEFIKEGKSEEFKKDSKNSSNKSNKPKKKKVVRKKGK